MEDILKDKRFAHIAKDPRFRKMPKGHRKVKIDKRFKDMFEDKRFKLKYTVDSRGRPMNMSSNEDLKKFYELSESDSSDSEAEEVNEDEADVSDSKPETEDDSDHSSDSNINKKLSKKEKEKEMKKSSKVNKSVEIQSEQKVKKLYEKQKDKAKTIKQSHSSDTDNEGIVTPMKSKDSKKKGKKKEDITEKVLDTEIDYARGEALLESSSSDDDSDDSDDSDGEDSDTFDHKWNEQDDNVEEVSEATHRIAVCNLDWDRMKAKDIFFLLSSFKPAQGLIKSVKIYPSEIGKERLEQERLEGPKELKELKVSDSEENVEDIQDKSESQFQTEKLRQYQLVRLKYYYAVVECDTKLTADHIYKECDGKEYESSATKLDLRFIPEDMEFEDEPTSMCTEVPVGYKPVYFFNTALSQSKVDLTWDETDRERTQRIARQFEPKSTEDLEDDDLNAYLASSSDEEGADYGALIQQSDEDSEVEDGGEAEEEDRQINKYKMLLQEIDQEDKKKDTDVQMEITWEPGLKEVTEEKVRKKKEKKEKTPWEDYLQRKKDKKKQKQLDKKQQRLEQQVATDTSEDEEGENDQDIDEGQAFSDDELPAGFDADDPFFADELKPKTKSHKEKKIKKKKKQLEKETEEDTKEKEALSLLVMGEESEKKHFSLKKLMDSDKKSKKKKKKNLAQDTPKREDNFQMDVEDPRFSAMYESHLFNIDPSAPEYKKTKGTEAILDEKIKRSKKKGKNRNKNVEDVSSAKRQKMDLDIKDRDDSLASLVNSVKMKTKSFKSSKTKV